MKRLLLVILATYSLHGWSFFFSDDEHGTTTIKPVTVTILIDPAGDAKDPGRIIDDTYERSLTMQCAEELKMALEKNNKGLRVIFTRFPGEALEAFQNVSFANRLKVDLYISLSFFQDTQTKPQLYIYNLLYDPATDFIQKKQGTLELLPYDQAYKVSFDTSKYIAQKLAEVCDQRKLTCHRPIALPYKPLMGILAPAIGLEIGISRKQQWKNLVGPLATAIQKSMYP